MTACARCGFDPMARVFAKWEMLIDRDPPSLNDRFVNAGAQRWRYKKERDEWHWLVRAARLNYRVPVAGQLRRRVTMVRLFNGRQRERDTDNLAGGMKAIVDALVLERLIVGDDPKSAEIHYTQTKGPLRGLRVIIEDLGA